MRGAFVVRLGIETMPSENHLEGWVEEVDSGKEFRFHSTTELVQFLGDRFRIACQPLTEKTEDRISFTEYGEEEL